MYHVMHSDALEALRELPDCSVDSIVTDPPAGIGFMGRNWDSDKGGRDRWIRWLADIMRECLRVLKPGGHALVWALPRTSHWTATAVEDAGFEIRDVVMHLFGSGFPKSLNVSKAIDDVAGVAPTVIGSRMLTGTAAMSTEEKGGTYVAGSGARAGATKEVPITVPTSDLARQWSGFGTALKPAAEHWILARKPLVGTVARNVLEYGTGALNVDGCRIGMTDADADAINAKHAGMDVAAYEREAGTSLQLSADPMPLKAASAHALGRWPANVTLDPEAAAMLDEQSLAGGMHGAGKARDASEGTHTAGTATILGANLGGPAPRFGDSGGASRFFYVAKPSTREREAGCEGLPRKGAAELTDREEDTDGLKSPRAGAGRTSAGRANHHPTVKSIALMRWLVRLITPPGGLVLDPFCGSGTTGCAAVLEGMHFIGVDQSDEYVAIATARIGHWEAQHVA